MLTVTDDDGGTSSATSVIGVSNVDPKAAILGVPEAAAEGSEITLTGGVEDAGKADTHTLAWEVTKDGEAYASGEGGTLSFTPDDNGVYEVTLTATDDDGGAGSATSVIEVSNVDPKAAIHGMPEEATEGSDFAMPEIATEGSEITLTAEVADAGKADTHTLAWEVTKDGEAYASGEGESLSFTPDDNGVYEVTLTATDDDGGIGSSSAIVTVENAAPELSDVEFSEFSSLKEVSGAIADAGRADSFQLQVSWGDGTVETFEYVAGTASFQETHQYEEGGIYQVELTLSDDDGGVDSTAQESFVTGARLHDGVLQIVGTPADDMVHVGKLGRSRLLVMADFLPDPWHMKTFAAGEVEQIDAVLAGGDDLAVVSRRVHAPAVLDGGAGSDILAGGSGDDVLIGGAEADLLFGGPGADLLSDDSGRNITARNSPQDTLKGEFNTYRRVDRALLSFLSDFDF
jgi:PKD repeat protein